MNESELPMTTALLEMLGEKKQEAPKPSNRYRQMIKQDAIDAATTMFNNLDPQCHCTDEYDLICEILEELAQ